MAKSLKEFPLDEPVEAADGCDYCKAKYQVTVTYIDQETGLGDIRYRLPHESDCLDRYSDDDDPYVDTNQIEYTDIAGWTFLNEAPITLGAYTGPVISSRANIGPCLNCWKLVVGVPLILFPDPPTYEMDFCFPCAQALGLFSQLHS